jgi:DNA-binding NarL/FixJ family response regulator
MPHDRTPGEQSIRVLVADNTHIHSQLLADALRRDSLLDVVGAVSRSRELLEAAPAADVHVAVISSNLDEEPLRGLEALRELRASRPEFRAVILLDSSKREEVVEAFRAGARGLFSRHESLETLCKCVRRVYEGQIWANSEQFSFAVESLAASPTVRAVGANGLSLLSKREMDVVRCLAEGLTNREIAERLGLSQHTIKNYLFRVFDKLGVSNRLELLFLTLSHPANGMAAGTGFRHGSNGDGSYRDESFQVCQQAAAQGLPTAQMALAQRYWQGKGVAQDLVSAYMWFLVSERASLEMKDEIVAAKRKLAEGLSTEQLVEAQRRASEHLKRTVKTVKAVSAVVVHEAPVRSNR